MGPDSREEAEQRASRFLFVPSYVRDVPFVGKEAIELLERS